MVSPTFHVAMLPWFAWGHITPFMKLCNKFAENGYRVSFFIPKKTQDKFNHQNLHPHLIQFIPLTVPQIDGLPMGTETTADVGTSSTPLLLQAFDLTKDQVEIALQKLKPDIVLYDHAYWVSSLARALGIKSVYLYSSSVCSISGLVPRILKQIKGEPFSELDLMEAPEVYPGSSSVMPLPYEMKDVMHAFMEIDGNISLIGRYIAAMSGCDALCFNTCREMEGPFVEYLEKQYNKKSMLIGPVLAEPSNTPLEERWCKWLSGFEKGSVVYLSFGSECILHKDQFDEVVLGLELTGFPFLLRLKPPVGFDTVEEALPEGFEERVGGRGVVHGGWVQQTHILNHPSVGCFIGHGGFASMWESLKSNCQIVMIPNVGDQFINTKFMTKGLKVAVDVERREEDGWFSKENVCKAVKLVMDEKNEVAQEIRANRLKWKDYLSTQGLEATFWKNFIFHLQEILK